MGKILKKSLQYIFFLGLGVFMVWYSLKNVDVKEVWLIILDSKMSSIIPSLILLLLSHWIRALRWNLLIHSIDHYPRRFNTFNSVMVGYFVNLFVPRMGEVFKCTILAKYEKVPADKLVGTMIVERIVDVLGLGVVILLALFTQFDLIGSFLYDNILPALKKMNLLYYVFILCALIAIVWVILKMFKTNIVVKKITEVLTNVWHGIKAVAVLKEKKYFLFYSVLIWVLYFTSLWIGFGALEGTKHLGGGAGLSILVMGSFGMIMTQGGIGAYPLLIMQTLMWYGIPDTIGTALGWLLWSAQTFLCLFVGFICWISLPIYNKK